MVPEIEKIELLASNLRRVSPSVDLAVSAALSGVKASYHRALSPEKRLSSAAKHSISVYIMTLISTVYQSASMSPSVRDTLKQLFELALSLGVTSSTKHIELQIDSLPEGWVGPDTGPWSHRYKNFELNLVHNKNMPGGSFSVCINNVPCLYGNDPAVVIEKTTLLIEDLEKKSPPFNSPGWAFNVKPRRRGFGA
jgi:hypothetical protein